MAYPCFPAFSCKTCTSLKQIWAQLMDNDSFCCFKDAEQMDYPVSWATDDPLDCPEEAMDYGKYIKGFLLGLVIIAFAALFVWFFIRRAFCRQYNVPMVFEHSDVEDGGYDSGSGGSEFEATTSESDNEENHEHSE